MSLLESLEPTGDLTTGDVDARLRDGTRLRIAQLHPDEAAAVATVEKALGPLSRHLRWFASHRIDLDDIERGLHLPGHLVLAGSVGDRPVGLIELFLADDGTAELAMAVADAWQARGVGTALVHRAVALARELGIRRLTADVLRSNLRMARLVRGVGAPLKADIDDGVEHFTLRIDRMP